MERTTSNELSMDQLDMAAGGGHRALHFVMQIINFGNEDTNKDPNLVKNTTSYTVTAS
jgi:hypothetical protein